MNTERTETRHQMYALEERLQSASGRQEKNQILLRYQFSIKSRLSTLQNAERAASQKYNDGTLTTRQYTRRLALIDAQAAGVERSISWMAEHADDVPRFAPQVWTLRGDLVTLQGPVRQSIGRTIRGQSDANVVSVAATKSGVVLATTRGSQYVREAYRADYRKPKTTGTMSYREAQNVTVSQYPWLQSNSVNVDKSTDVRYSSVGIWKTDFVHPQGVIEAYLDGSTKEVFREVQYKDLTGPSRVPYGPAVRNNSTDLELAVNRTYSGGPLRVNLTDANGNPVNGTVEVAGTELGPTGADGVLMTVAPREQFTVSARRGLNTVSVTVRPYGVQAENATSGPSET